MIIAPITTTDLKIHSMVDTAADDVLVCADLISVVVHQDWRHYLSTHSLQIGKIRQENPFKVIRQTSQTL